MTDPISTTVLAHVVAHIHPDADGGYWAEVPALPGCVAQGDSPEEVRERLHATVAGWLMIAHDLATDDRRWALAQIDRATEPPTP